MERTRLKHCLSYKQENFFDYMKSFLALVIILLSLVYMSCQKEIDWGLGGTGSNNLLSRINSKTGTDSSEVSYFYNTQNRLIREKTTGVSGGLTLDNELIINRNAAGVILTTVQKAASLVIAGIDSVVTRYNYNTSTSRYTSSVFSLTAFGFSVTDSAVYSYDASGKIVSDVHYLATGFLPPIQSLKNDYTYSADGVNISRQDQMAATTPGGPMLPVSSQTYTYDNKSNPLILSHEAVLLSKTGLFNANNSLKTVFTNTADPTANFNLDIIYRYNTEGKPDSAFSIRTPPGELTVSAYHYQ